MSDIVWAGICAVAFAFGAVCLFLRLNITAAEADALADAIIASKKTSGTKNLLAYRIGQLLERHGRCNAVQRREFELSRLRLTDAERNAIYRASQYLSQNDVFEGMAADAATLRGLLERTK